VPDRDCLNSLKQAPAAIHWLNYKTKGYTTNELAKDYTITGEGR